MEITVNGKATDVGAGLSVEDLLHQRGFTKGKVIVEYNGEILVAAGWREVILSPGDRMEIVTFVGGG